VLAARTSAIGAEPKPIHATENTTGNSIHSTVPSGPPQQIAMLIYPQFTALDLVGPHAFLSGLMNVDVHLVWKNKDPIATDRGNLTVLPSATLAECPKELDILFVPGGLEGTVAVMQDDEVLSFLADRGSRARYVTSVCTGSLILGCAGLLNGYRATSHWAFRDLLPLLGAVHVNERVVEDRNRITGAGVTSGIDFGLTVSARMRGVRYAEMLQLVNEYDPHPPFHAGTPTLAGPEITNHLREVLGPGLASAKDAALMAHKKVSAG
jgi:cyclohexyl-isocyanide hydratase